MNILSRTAMILKFLLATIIDLIFGKKPPKPSKNISTVAELEEYIDSVVKMNRPPGLSIAVVKDGRMVYNKAFGLADGPGKVPATNETVYHWMSMTKMTTAVSIMHLQDQGELNIDDPVEKYLPFFKVKHRSEDGEVITIRHLLNHSSGLANPPGMLGLIHLDGESHPNQVRLAEKLMSANQRLAFETGTQATYSNLNYTVLGAIIEKVSGIAHREYVVQNIFRPLKMNSTNFVYNDLMLEHAAVGSQPNGNILSVMLAVLVSNFSRVIRETVKGRMWFNKVYPDFTGAAGVIGPANETARFVMAFLNKGELDGERILSSESVRIMTNDSHVRGKGGPATFYKGVLHGLGWLIWNDMERKRIMHSGDGPGFSGIMQLFPEENLGVIVQGNEWAYGVSFRGTSIRDSIAALAAGLEWND